MSDKNHKEESEKIQPVELELKSPIVTSMFTVAGQINNRLAQNSNYCKTLCLTVVGLVFGLKATISWQIFIPLILVVLVLAYFDAFYITLKKGTESMMEDFLIGVQEKHNGIPFVIAAKNKSFKDVFKNLGSKVILPFYGVIILALVIFFLWSLFGKIE